MGFSMPTPAGVVVENGSECIFAHTGPRENKETFTKKIRTKKLLQNWRTAGVITGRDLKYLEFFPAPHCDNNMAAALCLWGVELLQPSLQVHQKARDSSYTCTIDTCILTHNRDDIHVYKKALPVAAQCESNKEKSFI